MNPMSHFIRWHLQVNQKRGLGEELNLPTDMVFDKMSHRTNKKKSLDLQNPFARFQIFKPRHKNPEASFNKRPSKTRKINYS